MKATFLCFVLLFMLTAQGTFAGRLAEVELTDGSVIQGEIVSSDGGTYTLKSDSLGIIRINESSIRNIRLGASEAADHRQAPAAQPALDEQIKAMQELMLSDQSLVDMISSLGRDPEFQDVLKDPDVMNAIGSGNLPALIANPKFMQLINKPAVQEIIRKSTR
jgi:hypothetical protein